MRKLRLLDLCCCAGGCSAGYARAGFEVTGVDIEPQPHYPFTFVQADALTYPLTGFDVVHVSPPCHLYSTTRTLCTREKPHLIPPFREKLQQWGGPWIMENVAGAPLRSGVVLCGCMFGLRLIRQRVFESNVLLFAPGNGKCDCKRRGRVKHGDAITVVGHDFRLHEGRQAMGIDWMNLAELAQAIPPVYTEWLGRQLLEVLA